jgi:aldose 1-epimerase
MLPRPEAVLSVGDVEIRIDLDRGARATRWAVGACSLLAKHDTDLVNYGMYPMAPWAGRLRGNQTTVNGHLHEFPATYGPWAMHGTVLAQPADVVEFTAEPNVSRLVARVSNHPGWPWPTDVDITWELRERELRTTIEVVPGEDVLPTVVGWHPWFRRDLGVGGPLEWSLPATQMAERGDDHLPTGRLVDYDPSAGPFDDAFVVPTGRASIRWPGVLTVDVASSAGWFVVFDELPATVCLEPQSGPPNGLNDGIIAPVPTASPDSGHVLVTTWVMIDEPPADPI